jgi:hypothetical protein
MKIIFLDVDGVLNSVRSMLAFHDEYRALCSQGSFNREQPRSHCVFNHIDSVAIKLLNRITDESGAKYVISSTHRKHIPDFGGGGRDMKKMKQYFADFGLTGEVIGYTPCHSDGFRGREIEKWIESYFVDSDSRLDAYAIVDDSDDMTDYQKANHFVHTSVDDGFGMANFRKLKQLMGLTAE